MKLKWRILYKVEYFCARIMHAENQQDAFQEIEKLSAENLVKDMQVKKINYLGGFKATAKQYAKKNAKD